MYPERELRRLAAHKAALQVAIAMRRTQCADAAAQVARPLEWLDRVVAFCRKFSPLIQISAVPLGFLVKRAFFPRFKMLGFLTRWVPLAYGAMRGVTSAFRAHGGGARE
jgi:hypothetical protein